MPHDPLPSDTPGAHRGSARVAILPGLIHRAVEEEVFVLMADSTVHWLKNATATTIWRAIEAGGGEGTTLDELARILVRAFEVEPARARSDIGAFVEALRDRGLVVVTETPSDLPGAD